MLPRVQQIVGFARRLFSRRHMARAAHAHLRAQADPAASGAAVEMAEPGATRRRLVLVPAAAVQEAMAATEAPADPGRRLALAQAATGRMDPRAAALRLSCRRAALALLARGRPAVPAVVWACSDADQTESVELHLGPAAQVVHAALLAVTG